MDSTTPAAASPPEKPKVHPAAEIFPMMDDEQYQKLKADIEQHGQREPAVFYKGQLLDGRNRAKACEELGIELSECELDADKDPESFVVSANLHRRHLKPSQRAAIAADILPNIEAEAKKRQIRKPKSVSQKVDTQIKQRSDDQAAKAVGVNRQYVSDAKKLKDTDPETFKKVRAGEVSLAQAKRKASPKKKTPKKKSAKTKRQPSSATNPKLTAAGIKAASNALSKLSKTLDAIGLLYDLEGELYKIHLLLSSGATACEMKQKSADEKLADALGGEVKPPKRPTKTQAAGRSKVVGKKRGAKQ